MNETVFEQVESFASILKLDISAEAFAQFTEDQELSENGMEAVRAVFAYLSRKKQQTTIQTLLKMSQLPTKAPRTFENFDFSLLKGKDVERLRLLPSLNAIYSHRNLAFIGPAGTGKTHLAQAFGYACCQHGMKTYFIKVSELRDRFTAARRSGKTDACLNGLVRPSYLIIDEIGHCAFDKENTRLFFDRLPCLFIFAKLIVPYLTDLLSTGIFFRGSILSSHMVYLLCDASILHLAGGLHKIWGGLPPFGGEFTLIIYYSL